MAKGREHILHRVVVRNIDLTVIPEFSTFMETNFDIPIGTTDSLLNKNFFNLIRKNELLLTTHDRNSYYNTPLYSTGFNWTNKYI